jgi:flavin-dependent dehydrogenase
LHLKGEVLNYFSGKGNVISSRRSITRDNVLLVGEAAGLIDPCFGFGFKYAVISSYLAGKIILENKELGLYEESVKRAIYPSIRRGGFNKKLLGKLDNTDMDLILRILKELQEDGVNFTYPNREIIWGNKAKIFGIFLRNPRLFLLIAKMLESF